MESWKITSSTTCRRIRNPQTKPPTQGYRFVTNKRADFLVLHGQEPLHAGVIIIVPNVTPVRQREPFTAALKHIGARDLTNVVVEVKYAPNQIECSEYALPRTDE
jgi:hypothetical protein